MRLNNAKGEPCDNPTCQDAADRAVKLKVFAILGVDVDKPESVEEFREDLRFGKRMRRAADHRLLALVRPGGDWPRRSQMGHYRFPKWRPLTMKTISILPFLVPLRRRTPGRLCVFWTDPDVNSLSQPSWAAWLSRRGFGPWPPTIGHARPDRLPGSRPTPLVRQGRGRPRRRRPGDCPAIVFVGLLLVFAPLPMLACLPAGFAVWSRF